MPFLPYPENLKGYLGDDVGFDPLRISDYVPMDYLRESELKHGRICMAAIVGFIAVDQGFVIHPLGQGLSSVQAHDVLCEKGVMGNALVFIGFAEIVSWLGIAEMLQGSGRAPGDFGLDGGFLAGKSEEQINKLKYQELKVRIGHVVYVARLAVFDIYLRLCSHLAFFRCTALSPRNDGFQRCRYPICLVRKGLPLLVNYYYLSSSPRSSVDTTVAKTQALLL
jgi:light-harvesting complex I chlorophyll a/b binding protein 1